MTEGEKAHPPRHGENEENPDCRYRDERSKAGKLGLPRPPTEGCLCPHGGTDIGDSGCCGNYPKNEEPGWRTIETSRLPSSSDQACYGAPPCGRQAGQTNSDGQRRNYGGPAPKKHLTIGKKQGKPCPREEETKHSGCPQSQGNTISHRTRHLVVLPQFVAHAITTCGNARPIPSPGMPDSWPTRGPSPRWVVGPAKSRKGSPKLEGVRPTQLKASQGLTTP